MVCDSFPDAIPPGKVVFQSLLSLAVVSQVAFSGHSTGLSGSKGKEIPKILFWAFLLQSKY